MEILVEILGGQLLLAAMLILTASPVSSTNALKSEIVTTVHFSEQYPV